MFKDAGTFVLRATVGGLMAGHGAQKLFGWFGGYGLEGTSGWLESLGLRPGRPWAVLAGLSEFGGGLLTALGAFHPIGPITMLGSMGTAAFKVHWGKPIWVTEGGAELPVTNMAVGLGLALNDPGRFSVDRLFGIRVPRTITILAALAVLVGTILSFKPPVPAPNAELAGEKLQAEDDTEAMPAPPTGEPDYGENPAS